jgi:hypothetical protein
MDKEHLKKMQEARKRQNQFYGSGSGFTKELESLKSKGIELPSWILKSQINVFIKAFSGKSKAAALKAKCIDCAAGYQLEITNCRIKSCPLWRYRPYQKKGATNAAV